MPQCQRSSPHRRLGMTIDSLASPDHATNRRVKPDRDAVVKMGSPAAYTSSNKGLAQTLETRPCGRDCLGKSSLALQTRGAAKICAC